MSTFAALGLAAGDEDAFDALVHRAADEGAAETLGEDLTLVRWRPPEGAWLDLVVQDGEVVCATPQWSARHRRPVRITALERDPDCTWCSVLVVEVLDDVGAVVHPLVVQPAGTAVLGPRPGTTTEAGAVLVAEVLHLAAEAADGVRASGLEGGPPAAYASVVGTLATAERRQPDGGSAHWVTTLDVDGAPWDLLVADGLVPDGLAPGVRLEAGCWVCGEVGYPGGAGPGGVEGRRERRWNWRP